MKAKRKDPTARVKREICARQNDECFITDCHEPIAVFEHWTMVAIGNDDYPDCGLCERHADIKTYGGPGRVGGDIRDIAHIKRLQKKAAGETKPKKPIPSPGFDKTKTKKLGTGKVVERKR